MASPSDSGHYTVYQSTSTLLEIDHFDDQSEETALNDCRENFVSLDGDSLDFNVQLNSSGYYLELTDPIDTNYVYISLTYCSLSGKSPPETMVRLEVSLIDAKGEKQFTQHFGMKLEQLIRKEILSRFCSREDILFSPLTYLHAGTLKVLFEISLLNKEASTPVTSLLSDYASLLETGSDSDVTLLVGEREFPVHKLVLSARSPVFARMFARHLQESKENQVVLEDVSEKVLQELLSFIYTARVESLEEHASELLAVAEKYQIESLKAICGQSLSRTLNADTLPSLLQMATLYNVPQLKRKCLAFFAEHSKEIKLSDEWKQFIITESNLELLGLLLQSVMLTE